MNIPQGLAFPGLLYGPLEYANSFLELACICLQMHVSDYISSFFFFFGFFTPSQCQRPFLFVLAFTAHCVMSEKFIYLMN